MAANSTSRRGVLQGISVQTPLGEKVFDVRRFEYTEKLGEPFRLVLELESDRPSIAGSRLVGQGFSVTLTLPSGGMRHFHAIMGSFARIGREGRIARYRAVGVPWFSLLKLAENSQIFQDMNLSDLAGEVLGGFEFAKFEWKAINPTTHWESRTQYRESYFNFIQRSTQQEGIYYFWTHEQSQHTLTFCDSLAIHAARFVRAQAEQTSFAGADLSYADFSHCLLNQAIMTDAITTKTNLHGVADTGVAWTRRQLATALRTDQDLYEAETWRPPP
jgi:uncharacterized protein involved in type VI secretion and phage assembly